MASKRRRARRAEDNALRAFWDERNEADDRAERTPGAPSGIRTSGDIQGGRPVAGGAPGHGRKR